MNEDKKQNDLHQGDNINHLNYDPFIDGLNPGLKATAEQEEIQENPDVIFDIPIEDEFDLFLFLQSIGAKTRREKIYLLLATFFSVVGPLIFITGLVQLPFVFDGYLDALMKLISITCRFTSEDIDGFALDMTLTRLEGVRASMTSVFLTIGVAAAGITYQGVKKCRKRKDTRELIAVLDGHGVKNAKIIADYEFSRENMRKIRHNIMRNGLQKESLEELKEVPSRCERIARDIQSYRQECTRYAKILFITFAIPGLVVWMQKADSLGDKIGCNKSTVIWDNCPADQQYQHLALLAYPYASASLGGMGVLTALMLLYFFTPKRAGEWLNKNFHQKILKFFQWREEDKPRTRVYTYIWYWGYIVTLMPLLTFCVTLAYKSTQEFAEISHCASVFEQWLSIIFGYDASTPECPQSTASLIFGGGVANLEIDKFYPLYVLDETFFAILTFLAIKFTPIRRVFTQEHMEWFIKEVDRCHEKAFEAGSATVMLIGIPLFYRAVNFALPIVDRGITETVHFNDLSMDGTNVLFSNMTVQQGAEKICPYDSVHFIEQLQKSSIDDLAKSLKYIGDGNVLFIIAKSCPQYASYKGALILYGLTLGNKIIDCNELTAIRFFSAFVAVYWSGVSFSFCATYLPVFYGELLRTFIRSCRGVPDEVEVPLRPMALNRHRLMAHRAAVNDEKQAPLLDSLDDIASDDDDRLDEDEKEVVRSADKFKQKRPALLLFQNGNGHNAGLNAEVDRFEKLHSSSSSKGKKAGNHG